MFIYSIDRENLMGYCVQMLSEKIVSDEPTQVFQVAREHRGMTLFMYSHPAA
jgi:hypothetical protein